MSKITEYLRRTGAEGYEPLERDRNEKARAYREYVVDWNVPESIQESGRLFALFHDAARQLDLH